jgi:alpha-mannosidase
VALQPTEGGCWIDAGEVPPYSVLPLSLAEGRPEPPDNGLNVSSSTLENNYLRVELNPEGDIVRIYDKAARREVLPEGAIANQFQAFEDRSIENYEAWEVEIFYDDRMWAAGPADSIEVVSEGPLRAALEIRRRIMHSSIVQRIVLAHNSPRLDFETTIDWQERHMLLKVAFPVDILSPSATYEIPWGNLERPTHHNTSWDWARFEVSAQKWADLSEGGYGVSLLNDCKYGHDIRGNVIRLSLLRSPAIPDPKADRGEHVFTYSLLPHQGPWGAETVAAAYALNDPLKAVRPEKTGRRAGEQLKKMMAGFVSVDSDNVVIETVKQAEDGEGIIVRLYECMRKRGPVTLAAGFDLARVWITDLLEEKRTELSPQGNQVEIYLKPYEIITLRLLPA